MAAASSLLASQGTCDTRSEAMDSDINPKFSFDVDGDDKAPWELSGKL